MATMPLKFQDPSSRFLSAMEDVPSYLFGALITACLLYVGRILHANSHLIHPFLIFGFTNFINPIGGKGLKQQDALENFYRIQAHVYDVTRAWLLRGREEMLALVAAQLKYQVLSKSSSKKPTWIDVGGGTGWNIEAMAQYIDVPRHFSKIYLVDLSPSLLAVAQQRFDRLGWDNVEIICQDALEFCQTHAEEADLITLSYSLSMLPNYHAMIDSFADSLSSSGIVAVVDFYVQNEIELQGRRYMGGVVNRHVNWISRTFWRAWFELDRISLEGARRDYLEHRFGTLKCLNLRNPILSNRIPIAIPYYIFIGRLPSAYTLHEDIDCTSNERAVSTQILTRTDSGTECGSANPRYSQSKACQVAHGNLAEGLPLPSTFYQNRPYRKYYDEQLRKHAQFGKDFIYAFTWEDSDCDRQLLSITPEDVILCLTSAGDNLLDYIQACKPRRVHAVDLNPNQTHLLELKVASYQGLTYPDFWAMFGEGHHPDFRDLLVQKISPYLSSQALQHWLDRSTTFSSRPGLYSHGGSGVALKLIKSLLYISGLHGSAQKMCRARSLPEQWQQWLRLRRVLLSPTLHWLFVNTQFLWKAAGVPAAQAKLIIDEYQLQQKPGRAFSQANEGMWQYISDTFDPVARDTLLSDDNFYYLLVLNGKYTKQCKPPYLSRGAFQYLSRPGAFDGLTMHTDEVCEVIKPMLPGSLTLVMIMDSMDWFDPERPEAMYQAKIISRGLKTGGRVFLRSAAKDPWYIAEFEKVGFLAQRVGVRTPGACIDRVNMYASTWILVKSGESYGWE